MNVITPRTMAFNPSREEVDSECAASDESGDERTLIRNPNDTERPSVRKWIGVAFVTLGLMGVIAVTLGVSTGNYSKSMSDSGAKKPSVNKDMISSVHNHVHVATPVAQTQAEKAAPGFTMGEASSKPSSSAWSIGTAPVGTVHMEAAPRQLTVAEFMQTSKFSHKMADQARRLKDGNFDRNKPTYNSPEMQIQAHSAASRGISDFLIKLAKSHPKVAMMLHKLRLDDEQQEVIHNSVDHFTSKKTLDIGSEVMKAALESTFQGKDALKKRLQEQFGKGLKPLYELRSEIFPKDFDPEKKHSIELPDSEVPTSGDADEAHLQIMKQSARRFRNEMKAARRLQETEEGPGYAGEEAEGEEEEEEHGPMFIMEIVSETLAIVVGHIITLAFPGKVGEIIASSLEDLEAIFNCVKIAFEKDAWIGCAIHTVGAALETVEIFTKKEEGEEEHD